MGGGRGTGLENHWHRAHWVQNNKTDGYTSVASRIATTAVWDTEAVISWGGDAEKCDVEEVNLGCGAACASQIWVERIQAAMDDSHDAVIFTDGSRGEDGRTPSRQVRETAANILEKERRSGTER